MGIFYGPRYQAPVAKPEDDAQRKELETLRAEKQERDAKDRAEAERKKLEEYKKREWADEGHKTGIQSLVIDGGKLWRIQEHIYFQASQTCTTYHPQYMGLGGGLGYQSTTSYGSSLVRLT